MSSGSVVLSVDDLVRWDKQPEPPVPPENVVRSEVQSSRDSAKMVVEIGKKLPAQALCNKELDDILANVVKRIGDLSKDDGIDEVGKDDKKKGLIVLHAPTISKDEASYKLTCGMNCNDETVEDAANLLNETREGASNLIDGVEKILDDVADRVGNIMCKDVIEEKDHSRDLAQVSLKDHSHDLAQVSQQIFAREIDQMSAEEVASLAAFEEKGGSLSQELARACRQVFAFAIQQMNEEQLACLAACTAMPGIPALTAVSEILLSALTDDVGMAVIASRYLAKAKEKRERTKKIKAMANALSAERKNITTSSRSRLQQKAPAGKKMQVSEPEKVKDEASLTASTASTKYTASVTKGIKKSSTHWRKSKKSSRKAVNE